MMQQEQRERQLRQALTHMTMPSGVECRVWTDSDFPAIQQLSNTKGWPTPQRRPDDALAAWRDSWPALVAIEAEYGEREKRVIGFVRAITDGSITLYVAELLVEVHYRNRGIGQMLLDTCHYLYPHTRIELMSMETSQSYYRSHGFRFIGDGFRKSYM
jgi:ribosomal protein S18 acetylase RimI-like enzyme